MTRNFALALFAGMFVLSTFFISPTVLLAQESGSAPDAAAETPAEEKEEEKDPVDAAWEGIPENTQMWYAIGNIMLFVCAVLVLFMQAGFSMVEAGFNASKNTVNILFKNVMDLCVGALLFWIVGYNLMYPYATEDEAKAGNHYFAFSGPFAAETVETSAIPEIGAASLDPQVSFLFQVAFAATAATIVSGAVAGRMKFSAYLIYSALLTGLIYPISGMWKWGYGWLHQMGFADFAGSLVVHAVGGFAGLAGAIVLGPRIGRFSSDGKPQAMPGHNLAIAALGVFILWVGWYGFNPGSQLDFSSAKNIGATMLIAVNTTLAAAAGGFVATMVSWVLFKKPDLSMGLNGILAGLVGITANCDCVTNMESVIIGAVAGGLVVGGILLLDKLRIDDPVGAWPVHGLCGVWGGIATGIFGGHDLGVQLLGSLVIPLWAFVTMFAVFMALKAVGMLRVSPEEEAKGLDITEHGMHAYETA